MSNMHKYEQEHLAIMRSYAPECTVLLKKNGDFPLTVPGKIALYGNGARRTVKGGTGSGDVNSRFFITAEQGLEEAGFTVTSKKWLDSYDNVYRKAHKQFVSDIYKQARQQHTLAFLVGMGAVMPEPAYKLPMEADGDTAVYVLARISGEGNDRKPEAGDIRLSETEIRDILECSRRYKHFMLVLNVGGVVDLTPVLQVQNILILSQLGAVTGRVLADLLLGRAVPSGKLTTTWSAWDDYCTIGDFGGADETRYREGIYVGYRYFDSIGKRALFPFGSGLSYTDFRLGKPEAKLDGTKVTVSLDVRNVGSCIGKEVVQVYVSVPWGKLDQPYQTLAGFAKTHYLTPGETETVSVSFGMESLAGFDPETAASILEAGSYILRVGTDSVHTEVCGAVLLNKTVILRRLSHVGGTPDFTDWKPERFSGTEETDNILPLDASAFDSLTFPAPHVPSEAAAQKAASLSDEELLFLCHGAFKPGMDINSVIGSAATQVAGAAGESYGKLAGIPGLVMADGPAGLRLSPHYTRDEEGAHSLTGPVPADMQDFMGLLPNLFLKLVKKKPKGEILEQYCTAIPIGTALAQSWNLMLCEACGDVVGREMERFGVDLWLAPAFNIHRSPLCGRNFEYYSEDPLICGKIAAAITCGVQKHPGKGTTIKHFCCNNQEYNRYISNSLVSERALREMYLRGFEICIRESDPASLMTSYNLLNGVHTSERDDLMNTLLRDEWGYGGLIMTDWVIGAMGAKGAYRMAKSAPTIAAGNDIFMPGCSGDYKLAQNALRGKDKQFTLTRQQIELCAAHLIDIVWRLRGSQL